MKNKLIVLLCSVIIFIAIGIPGCNSIENVTNSSTKLILELITGQDLEGNTGSSVAFCDVIYTNGGIVNDSGEATFSAQLLNPNAETSTFYQDLIVDQVDIEYSRADGLNVQGKDVPYSFSQKVHARVTVAGATNMGFVLVQHNAKLESPLVELVNAGQEVVLKLEAKVTFHAKDMAGNRVEPAVGYISVWCANFADDET